MKTIDIHTHGIAGYDTKTKSERDILKIAKIHGSRGVSEILPAIYPASISKMRENLDAVKKAMKAQKSGMPEAQAKILGAYLEGPFLNPLRCGALDKGAFLKPAEYNLKKLIHGFEDIIKIITIAPELDGAIRLIKTISNMGIIVSMGHSDATYAEAEKGYKAGARGITHIFNAMRGIHHREPGIAGFALLNQDIYIEVIGDLFHLHPGTIKLIFKVKNPKRIIIVSDSVKGATSPGEKGVIPAVQLRGGSMTITQAVKRLGKLDIPERVLTACITKNPERYLRK